MSFHEYCCQTSSQVFAQHNVDFGNMLEKIEVEEVEFDFQVSKVNHVIQQFQFHFLHL